MTARDRLDIQAPGIDGPPASYYGEADTRMDRFDIAEEVKSTTLAGHGYYFWNEEFLNHKPDVVADLLRMLRLMAFGDSENALDMLLLFRSEMADIVADYAKREGK